ncbi:hypothetical protein ACIBG8_32305 [Nonomuraea sp. NPDC050556]|uniref:hypothetical protein n=1 Tax=Nonomuraea sp. NPDC050556 TaxID=3364369 RepID=UPI003790BD77
MTTTERDLRDLLEQDSADGHHRGVTVADVDARVRGLRRRRRRTLGAVLVAGAAVTVLANLPHQPVAPADTMETGTAMEPPGFLSDKVLVSKSFQEAGKRETFTFVTGGRRIGIRLDCPRDSYAMAWVNGRFMLNTPCGPVAEAAGIMAITSPQGTGRSTVTVAVVPRTSAGSDSLTSAEADELVAWASAYPAKWSVTIMEDSLVRCDQPIVIVDPGSGQQILSQKCPS